jgi:hypothetical protein
LKYFFVPETKNIQDVPCKGGVFHIVGLHPNGKLLQCTLSGATVIDGREYPKGKQIKLADDGTVLEPEQRDEL